jgi:hypothetical protein
MTPARGFPFHLFEVAAVYVSDAHEYIDVELVDSGRNGYLRKWRITFVKDASDRTYGYLRRAKDEQSPFDWGTELPAKLVNLFEVWLIMKGVVKL